MIGEILSNIIIFIGFTMMIFAFGWWFYSEVKEAFHLRNIDRLTLTKMERTEEIALENSQRLSNLESKISHCEECLENLQSAFEKIEKKLDILLSDDA